MRTIGNYNPDEYMTEQLETYEVNGYKFSDLKPEHKEAVKALAHAIDVLSDMEPNINTTTKTMQGIEEEFKVEAISECVVALLSELGMAMFSYIDGYAADDL